MVQPSFYFYSFMDIKVLFAVLNWGLGHATRSEALIQSLEVRGAKITVASSGLSMEYLKHRFPKIAHLVLPDSAVNYSKKGASFGLLKRALIQKDLNKKQYQWTMSQLDKEPFDLIISDNIYGVYAPDIPSVLVTHQLKPLSPIFQKGISKEIASWINNFDEVWIPDIGDDGIAGEMLNNPAVSIPRKYMGNISRFKNMENKKDLDFLGIISGPQPQAEVFNQILLKKLRNKSARSQIAYTGKIPEDKGNIVYLEPGENWNLNQAILRSHLIICRSGFTSLLDILRVKGSALIVPTPGQPEQEYLAQRMNKLDLMQSMNQKAFQRFKLDDYSTNSIDDKWSVSYLEQVMDNFLTTKMPSVR